MLLLSPCQPLSQALDVPKEALPRSPHMLVSCTLTRWTPCSFSCMGARMSPSVIQVAPWKNIALLLLLVPPREPSPTFRLRVRCLDSQESLRWQNPGQVWTTGSLIDPVPCFVTGLKKLLYDTVCKCHSGRRLPDSLPTLNQMCSGRRCLPRPRVPVPPFF